MLPTIQEVILPVCDVPQLVTKHTLWFE